MKDLFSFFEKRIQFLGRIFLDLFLNMQIVLCHIHIRMSGQTLDGFQRYTLGLKLGDIGVTAAMWGKKSDLPCGDQRLSEVLAEYAGIADRNFLAMVSNTRIILPP